MMDDACPLAGWPIKEVIKMSTAAEIDIYGALHRCLFKVLESFCLGLRGRKIAFYMSQLDATEMQRDLKLPNQWFDRVEVLLSSFCHSCWNTEADF